MRCALPRGTPLTMHSGKKSPGLEPNGVFCLVLFDNLSVVPANLNFYKLNLKCCFLSSRRVGIRRERVALN